MEQNDISNKKEELKTNGENIQPKPMPAPQPTIVTPQEIPTSVQKVEVQKTQEIKTENNVIKPVKEFNTEKNINGNLLFFLAIIIILAFTFFIDDVINYFTEDNYDYLNGTTKESTTNGLINGYIKVGESDSYVTLENIKFYNFRQTTLNTITFDYTSSKSISNPSELKIYIELYNSNEELIYKELFNVTVKVEKDVISQYNINVSDSVYKSIFYSKVMIYSDEQLTSAQKLTCSYTYTSNYISLIYSNIYNFTNNELSSYSVSKSYTSKTTYESAEAKKYKEILKKEYTSINSYSIENTYDEKSLAYSIDLSNYPEGFTPLYNKGTLSKNISLSEETDGWKCE